MPITRTHPEAILSVNGTVMIGVPFENFPREVSTDGAVTLTYTTTGAPSALSVQFAGSQDGVSGWTNIGAAQTNTSTASVTMPNTLTYPWVRAALTGLTGGTNPTVAFSTSTKING